MAGDLDGEPLSEDDARILRLESAAVTGHTLKLNVLEPGDPVDVDALAAAVGARLERHPRARMRVDDTGPSPRWVPAADFDVRRHVRRVPAPGAGDDLWRVVGGLVSAHLPRDRPLWSVDVVGPFADGSEALAVRLHHAMADGVAGVRFLHAVLWDPHRHPGGVGPAGGGTRPGPPAAEVGRFDRLRRVPAAVVRELGHPGSRTPLDRPLGAGRELAFTALPLAGMKAVGAARPSPATVNDVLLAVVAGGLREWWADPSAPGRGGRPHVNAQVPVSLHRAGEGPAVGNRDSFLNIRLPLDEPDPLARLDRIRAQTRARKDAGDAQVVDDAVHAAGRWAALDSVVDRVTGSARTFGLSVSNVPGPRQPVGVAGRAVRHLFTSAEPAPHHALRIAAISSAGVARDGTPAQPELGIGLCTDPAAVSGLRRLGDALERAYDDLVRASG